MTQQQLRKRVTKIMVEWKKVEIDSPGGSKRICLPYYVFIKVVLIKREKRNEHSLI
jgi:hypothetical protein